MQHEPRRFGLAEVPPPYPTVPSSRRAHALNAAAAYRAAVAGAAPLGVSARQLAGQEAPPAEAGVRAPAALRRSGLGGALGLTGREQGLYEEIRALVTDPGGRWMALMLRLNRAMTAWRSARDAACGGDYQTLLDVRGEPCPNGGDAQNLAARYQARLERVMQVRDLLAEVYRRYDDFGLEAIAPNARGMSGALGRTGALGEPVSLLSIAAIVAAVAAVIGGIALWQWAEGEAEDAENRSASMDLARELCARDPNGPACLEALKGGQEPADDGGGVPWGLLIGGLVIAAGVLGVFEYRRRQAA